MGEIVNLRRARKAKARAEAEKDAAANRLAFGRGKAEKQATEAARSLETQRLDGHRRDPARDEGRHSDG
jgi:hypothetical protein